MKERGRKERRNRTYIHAIPSFLKYGGNAPRYKGTGERLIYMGGSRGRTVARTKPENLMRENASLRVTRHPTKGAGRSRILGKQAAEHLLFRYARGRRLPNRFRCAIEGGE